MGHFSMEKSLNPGSVLGGNQQLYGIKCSPHFGMGMVMVIRVGDAPLPEGFIKEDVPEPARKRFNEILVRNGFGK